MAYDALKAQVEEITDVPIEIVMDVLYNEMANGVSSIHPCTSKVPLKPLDLMVGKEKRVQMKGSSLSLSLLCST